MSLAFNSAKLTCRWFASSEAIQLLQLLPYVGIGIGEARGNGTERILKLKEGIDHVQDLRVKPDASNAARAASNIA